MMHPGKQVQSVQVKNYILDLIFHKTHTFIHAEISYVAEPTHSVNSFLKNCLKINQPTVRVIKGHNNEALSVSNEMKSIKNNLKNNENLTIIST